MIVFPKLDSLKWEREADREEKREPEGERLHKRKRQIEARDKENRKFKGG